MAFSGHHDRNRFYGSFKFEQKELQILDTRHALLNDICVNGLAALLQGLFMLDPDRGHYASRCALFSTYELNRIRYKASDTELWRNIRRTEYWTKDIWILPIHRPSEHHWVLAVIYPIRGEVYLYDSFAKKYSWGKEIMVSVFVN